MTSVTDPNDGEVSVGVYDPDAFTTGETCFGCGKSYSANAGYETVWHGEIAAGREIALCTGRYASDPKVACFAKALWKARCCPGCGEDGTSASLPGQLCRTCRASLVEGEAWTKAAPLQRSEVRLDGIHYHDEDDGSLVRTLARLVTGRGAESPNLERSNPTVEVTADQAAALRELVACLNETIDRVREAGISQGRRFLVELATGSISMKELESRS